MKQQLLSRIENKSAMIGIIGPRYDIALGRLLNCEAGKLPNYGCIGALHVA